MFNYGNANEAQKEAISATDGLVLITAGPGTGKTFTLVKRAVYLIQECGIKPEQIMMATFTEKAAKELITRITNELAERNVSVNVNEMYIGTFHSLCLRIIKENLEFTRLKRNYRLLDTFDQKYLVFRNFHKFKNIEGIDELLSKGGSWKRSDEICTYINHLSEEMVDIEALQSDDNPGIRTLANFLERNGINVYSPRSDMFFKRDEIKLALGCLMLMFPKYVMKLEKQEFDFLQVEHYRYYRECIVAANEYVTRADNKELLQFIRKHGKVHAGLTGTTDYAYSGLLYKLFMFRPFSDILDTDMSVGVVDIRPTRNLALLTQIIGKFEYLHRVDVFNGSYIDRNTELLFNLYLKLLYDGGISEYEDEAEYAPSGCVSFLTIHQSKGMEFPIVLVDSLSNVPRKTYKDLMTEVEEKYFHRPAFEPYDQTKYFDFWRLYYTAFSRAQNLLVLTCDENKRTPSQ